MKLRPGQRLASSVSDVEVVIVRAIAEEVDLRCGGAPMIALTDERPIGAALAAEWDGEAKVGKRWQHDGAGVEVLVTKPGRGLLAIGTDAMRLRAAKQLPASD